MIFSRNLRRVFVHIGIVIGSLGPSWMAKANDIDPNINRILSDAPDAARCKPIPQEECNTKRQRALDKSCVNQAEFNTLLAANDTPVCDYEEAPADRLTAWCPCGCFEENTNILALLKGEDTPTWIKVSDLYSARKTSQVVTLDGESTIESPLFAARRIAKSTKGEETEALYVLRAANGRTLKLTRNHGVLRGDGVMVKAHELVAGDALVTTSGEKVAITTIDREMTAGEVYNFLADTRVDAEHTLVAEGFVVGDLAWQNSLSNQLGSILLRK